MTDLLQLIEKFPQLKVLVIGEAILDSYLQGNSQRLCQEAPVPIVDINARQDVPGGAANTAANVASLGAQVVFLSVMGEDPEGDRLRHLLQQHHISARHLLTTSKRQTLTKQRILADSHLLLRLDQGSTQAITDDLEEKLISALVELFSTCDAVLVSDYCYGIMTPRLVQTLTKLQASHPRPLIVDSKQLHLYREIGITAVKPNYEEAIQLLGLPRKQGKERLKQITDHADQLLALTGAQQAAVTLDTEGALFLQAGSLPYRIPTQPTTNSQAAGAGDTFASALTLAFAAGADKQAAAAIAAAATAVVVTRNGTTTCPLNTLRHSLASQANKKLVSRENLEFLVQQHRNAGRRVVFTNGCFDILHPGHVAYLSQTKTLGDILIVGVNSDESVRQLKGPSRPVNALKDRLTVLAALESVDYVVPFNESTPCELIRLARPDVYVKGGDYTRETLPEASLVEELGGTVEILPYIGDHSTTSIIHKIYETASHSEPSRVTKTANGHAHTPPQVTHPNN